MAAVLTIESDEAIRLADDLAEIGRRCAALSEPPFGSADHADLYGEAGLPCTIFDGSSAKSKLR